MVLWLIIEFLVVSTYSSNHIWQPYYRTRSIYGISIWNTLSDVCCRNWLGSTFANELAPTSELLEVIFSISIVLSGLMLFTLLVGNIQVPIERHCTETSFSKVVVIYWPTRHVILFLNNCRHPPLKHSHSLTEAESDNISSILGWWGQLTTK